MSGQQLSDSDARALAALRQLLYRGTGSDTDEQTVVEAAQELAHLFQNQQERISELEVTVERLQATASGPELSKREKHEAIINAAQNKRQSGQGGPQGVPLDYAEVMAAANVSRRYAYQLMEELAAKYDWASYDTTGNKHVLKIALEGTDWAGLVASVHNNLSEG